MDRLRGVCSHQFQPRFGRGPLGTHMGPQLLWTRVQARVSAERKTVRSVGAPGRRSAIDLADQVWDRGHRPVPCCSARPGALGPGLVSGNTDAYQCTHTQTLFLTGQPSSTCAPQSTTRRPLGMPNPALVTAVLPPPLVPLEPTLAPTSIHSCRHQASMLSGPGG